MRSPRHKNERRLATGLGLFAFSVAGWFVTPSAAAQTCVTQARMTSQQRSSIGAAAYGLAAAVQAQDATRMRAATVTQYAGDPNATAYLVRSTGERLTGDSLVVTQVYLLDASGRQAGDTSEADFACPLSGSVAETDFAIPGLPPGQFAFAMVEARGNSPWLLAFLLQQENGVWKMAGFYPHARAAAGHDGIWYWTSARGDAKASKPWLAWALYGAADQLLRPASFVSSGNLDKLRSEQRAAAPEPLSIGLSAQTPLAVQGPGGTVYRVSELRGQPSDDGKALNLFVHLQSAAETGAGAASAEGNVQAARALLTSHPELQQGFSNVLVLADPRGLNPILVQRPIQDVMAAAVTR